jgi:uncharacterized protein YcsI (UPF0317 family)
MKINVKQNRINSVLSVIVSTSDWSRHELDSIVRFGEPTIQIGGKFVKLCTRCLVPRCPFDDSNDLPENCEFYVAEAEKKVRSDFPIMVEFGPDDFDEPELCARSWTDEIVGRIVDAVRELRQTSADIVREETYEV